MKALLAFLAVSCFVIAIFLAHQEVNSIAWLFALVGAGLLFNAWRLR